MNRIDITTKPERRDLSNASIRLLFMIRFFRWYLCIAVLLLIVGLSGIPEGWEYESVFRFLGFVSIVAIMFPFGAARVCAKEKLKLISEEAPTCFVDREGYGAKSKLVELYVKWEVFNAVCETKKYIFMRARGNSYIIYKHLLSDETLAAVKEILAQAPISKLKSSQAARRKRRTIPTLLPLAIAAALLLILLAFNYDNWQRFMNSRGSKDADRTFWTAVLKDRNFQEALVHTTDDLKNQIGIPKWGELASSWKKHVGLFKEYELLGVGGSWLWNGPSLVECARVDAKVLGDNGIIYIKSRWYRIEEQWMLNSFDMLFPRLGKESDLFEEYDIKYHRFRESATPGTIEQVMQNLGTIEDKGNK